jgi:hypothetical protein
VTSQDSQVGEGDGTKADEQANVEGKHGASRGGDVRAREGDAAVGAAACARLASDTRGADGPNGSAEPGGRVPHEGGQSIHCAVRESGCTRDRRSGESPPWINRRGGASGMIDGLCGISALGVSYVELLCLCLYRYLCRPRGSVHFQSAASESVESGTASLEFFRARVVSMRYSFYFSAARHAARRYPEWLLAVRLWSCDALMARLYYVGIRLSFAATIGRHCSAMGLLGVAPRAVTRGWRFGTALIRWEASQHRRWTAHQLSER